MSQILERLTDQAKVGLDGISKQRKDKRFDGREGFQRNLRPEEGRRDLLWRKVTG